MSKSSSNKGEPIAIIGSSCRFAGCTSPSKLWTLLSKPRDLSSEVPQDRFNAKAFYHADGTYHGTTNAIRGYWLEQDFRVFDASFFNITPKEAEAIDPQQRMLLEVVYEAMESAGYTLDGLSGQDIGVYAGAMTFDYEVHCSRDELSTSQYYATGNSSALLANRVSYFFNFHGPSLTTETACSSSLFALHQAVQSLRSEETSMACVTGVNLILAPELSIAEASLHMLSPDGTGRMWDASADGYARGDGVAALFLKPLSRAIADGDEIQGIIRETGVNADGRSEGITMPNATAQASLIASTYRRAGLDALKEADRCQYFEAHGTGTPAGDPKEASAIYTAFFGQPDLAESSNLKNNLDTLWVGSVKTVIGHSEGAAGIAGVLKVLQAMKNGQVPPNLHFKTLNPDIRNLASRLRIPTTATPWPNVPSGQPRRASVNSFGFGGANAHVIVEAYTPAYHGTGMSSSANAVSISQKSLEWEQRVATSLGQFPVLPLCFSAASSKSLAAVVDSWQRYLEANPQIVVPKLAWDLYSFRTNLPFRISISARSRMEALQMMKQTVGKCSDHAIRSRREEQKPKVLGLFTGQGAQWPTMSKALLLSSDRYRETIETLDGILQSLTDPPSWTLKAQINHEPEESRVNEAEIAQPLSTAIQIGLVDLLRKIGITFHTVVGHSSGEIAAAYAAGKLTARDAVVISYYRGKFSGLASGPCGEKGSMLAAAMTDSEAHALCRNPEFSGRVYVAAINSPESVTLSGDSDAIEEARQYLFEAGKFARTLLVDKAYHSPHMTKPADQYVKALERCGISPQLGDGSTLWVSSVMTLNKTMERDVGAQYWKDNMLYTVQFQDAVQRALSDFGPFDFVAEVGPHPALKSPVHQILSALEQPMLPYSGVLSRFKNDNAALSDFMGLMWSHFGSSTLDMGEFVKQSTAHGMDVLPRLENMPTYPWDHSQVHYRESRLSRQHEFRDAKPHELLGVRVRDDNEFELRWRNILKLEHVSWLRGHKFQGLALVPASAYCVMALDAAQVLLAGKDASIIEILDMDIHAACPIESDAFGVEIMFSLHVLPRSKNMNTDKIDAQFMIVSCPADGSTKMTKNVSGHIRIHLGQTTVNALPLRKQETGPETLPADPVAFYKMMDDTDLVYSGPFRSIRSVHRRFNYALAQLKKRHAEDTTKLDVSPATLDSCLQSVYFAYASPGDKSLWTSFLPIRVAALRFNIAMLKRDESQDNETIDLETTLTEMDPPSLDTKAAVYADTEVFDQEGHMLLQVEGLILSALARKNSEMDSELYKTTVMDLDPTDEIVQIAEQEDHDHNVVLMESFERVASLFSSKHAGIFRLQRPTQSDSPLGKWPLEWIETLRQFISTSPYRQFLTGAEAACSRLEKEYDEEVDYRYGQGAFTGVRNSVKSDELTRLLRELATKAHETHRFSLQLQRIVKQIAHKHANMQVLALADTQVRIEEGVLAGLGSSFTSLTYLSNDRLPRDLESVPESLKSRMHEIQSVDNLRSDGAEEKLFDLCVVSTSFLDKTKVDDCISKLRASMRDGSFFILVHVPYDVLREYVWPIKADFQDQVGALNRSGYHQVARNANQSPPGGFEISVSQANSTRAQTISELVAKELTGGENLMMIGGQTSETRSLIHSVGGLLPGMPTPISYHRDFDSIDLEKLSSCTWAIVLADIDETLMSPMTEWRIKQFQALFRTKGRVLWVTYDSRSGNPDNASSIGFLRTVVAEIPDLSIRVLDLDNLHGAPDIIVEEFLTLASTNADSDGSLWVTEPEVYVDQGRRLVPRVLPLQPFNDRLNATRRVVTRSVNTALECVRITSRLARSGAVQYQTEITDMDMLVSPRNGQIRVKVNFSVVDTFKIGNGTSVCLCFGQDLITGQYTVCMSPLNASFIDVPAFATRQIPAHVTCSVRFMEILSWSLVSLHMCRDWQDKVVVLIEPDPVLARCMLAHAHTTGNEVVIYTTQSCSFPYVYLHPQSSAKEIKGIFPKMGGVVFSFLAPESGLSSKVAELLPENYEYHTGLPVGGNLVDEDGCFLSKDAESIWDAAVNMAGVEFDNVAQVHRGTMVVTVPQLLLQSDIRSCVTLIDWRAEREIAQPVKPLVEENLLSPSKTYVIVGLTRDFGQSISRLFLEQGARNIVLSSRNPQMNPKWKDELNSMYGANICIMKLDITDLGDVLTFRDNINAFMPPVGGIVHGAMVLEDRIFAGMTPSTWSRVLAPKKEGCRNLDIAFSAPDLEFFIMTSSFAALGGHAGQSNYAAANMYLNGLAACRRSRGLPASALNIGVMYGLGMLHRDRKDDVYKLLERDGYPPVSERDIRHMFLEAIVAGRPNSGRTAPPVDIISGIPRFDPRSERLLHWQMDPRFCHLTLHRNDNRDKFSTQQDKTGLVDQLAKLESYDEIAEVILDAFCVMLRKLMRLPDDAPDRDQTFAELGVDSLLVVEMRAWVFNNFGREIAALKLLGSNTIGKLALELANYIWADRIEPPKTEILHKGANQSNGEDRVVTRAHATTPTAAIAAASATVISDSASENSGLESRTTGPSSVDEKVISGPGSASDP